MSNNLLREEDQSVVVMRPRYFVGCSGSVWASDYIRICHEYQHVYEVKSDFN